MEQIADFSEIDEIFGKAFAVICDNYSEKKAQKYSNLAQKTAVAVGDLVDTGAVLGEVGRTALAESGLEPHLHLELLADGEPVNPLAYLPKLN